MAHRTHEEIFSNLIDSFKKRRINFIEAKFFYLLILQKLELISIKRSIKIIVNGGPTWICRSFWAENSIISKIDRLLIKQYQLLKTIEHIYERFAVKQVAFKTLSCAHVQIDRLNFYFANFKVAYRNIFQFQNARPEHT